jgi:hypothetical protein
MLEKMAKLRAAKERKRLAGPPPERGQRESFWTATLAGLALTTGAMMVWVVTVAGAGLAESCWERAGVAGSKGWELLGDLAAAGWNWMNR